MSLFEKSQEKGERDLVPDSTHRMTLREAWKTSKLPYVELLYKSNVLSGATSTQSTPGLGDRGASQKRANSILKNAKMSKIVFTIFICLGTAAPFAEFAANPTPISFVSATTVSLLIGFAYLVFYSLQILPSFSEAEPYSLLLTLPFDEEEFSLVSMFSFIRTFDYLAVGSILIPVVAVAALSRSIFAGLLMLGASTINVVFAIVLGLWISRMFYRNITRGGRSKTGSLSRIVFLITWGFAVMSTGFLFQIVTYALPFINQILSGNVLQDYAILLSIVDPFTFGLAVAFLAFPDLFRSTVSGAEASLLTLLSFIASIAYSILAYFAIRRTAYLLTSITRKQTVTIVREMAKEFRLKLHGLLSAYMLKDIRSASKNPSTAFLFALPVFETLVIYLALSQRGTINVADVTAMTIMGSLFTLMTATLLLNTERKGLEYTLSLPLAGGTVVNAKSIIATLSYLPVPFVILLLQLPKSGIGFISLIPFVELIAISAATTAEISVLINSNGSTANRNISSVNGLASGRRSSITIQSSGFGLISGSNLGQMLKAILIALFIIAVPLVSYFTISSFFIEAGSVSILTASLVAGIELLVVQGALQLKL
jgi:hypothetical protein